MDLEELLAQLVALQPKAQEIYVRQYHEEYGPDEEPEGEVWFSLQRGFGADPRWQCGWIVQEDEATTWVLRAVARTATAAAQAMIEDLS